MRRLRLFIGVAVLGLVGAEFAACSGSDGGTPGGADGGGADGPTFGEAGPPSADASGDVTAADATGDVAAAEDANVPADSGSDGTTDATQADTGTDAAIRDATAVDAADAAVRDAANDAPADSPVDAPGDAPVDAPADSAAPDAGLLCRDAGTLDSVRTQVSDFLGSNLAGVMVGVSTCGAEVGGTTDGTGHATVGVPASQPFYFVFNKPGYFTSLSAEALIPVFTGTGDDPLGETIFPTAVAGADAGNALLFPGYDPAKGHILVAINVPQGATCSTHDGYVISITGHPEATIRYYGGGTMTDASGFAMIEKIAPGTPVTLLGTKTGGICSLNFAVAGTYRTGRIPVLAGAITEAVGSTTP